MLDGRYLHPSFTELRDEDGTESVSYSQRLRYVFRVIGVPNSPALVVKLMKIENIPTAIVWRKEMFRATLQSLQGFLEASEEENDMCFNAARLMDVVADMMFSNFLTINCEETYTCYITADEMMIKQWGLLPLL